MTTNEDEARLKKSKWKTKLCHVGSKCWCRMIETENGERVIGPAGMERKLAMYFVKLHNRTLLPILSAKK